MKTYSIAIATIALIITQLSCAPTLEVSSLEPPTEWSFQEGRSTNQSRLPQNWWESFNDTLLNSLIERALVGNRDLAASIARVESARSEIKADRSTYLPSLAMDATGVAERYNWEGRTKYLYIAPTVSWELPLFGALRSTNRKSQANVAASIWSLRGVELSVASEVASTYFKLREAKASYEIAKRSYQLRVEEAALIDSMARYGMSSGVDLNQALSLVYSAEADIALYHRTGESLRHSLLLLLGESRDETLELENCLTQLITDTPPITPPIMLPSELLERRWDVQQSWQELEAAAAEVGLAHAARFPSLSLSAGGGISGETIKKLTSSDPWAWSITGTLTEPIYNWGGLKSKEAAARSEYRATLMEYEQTMLQAISEVEQAMVTLESYSTERASQERLVAANRAIRLSVGALYTNGMEDYLNVIDAERSLYASEQSLIESITSQQLSYITLCKSLGGGY